MRTAKGYSHAADHGDPTSLLIAHTTLRSKVSETSIKVRSKGVVRYGVVFLRRAALYNRRMKLLSPAVALAAAVVAGCGTNDPEAEIRALLAAAEQAAEARDVGFFRDLVGAGYRDSRGQDRTELLRMLQGFFLANQRIEIVSRVDEVAFEGSDAARAVVHAGLLGQRSGADLLAGIDADLYRFELELVNDDGEWRIIGAAATRALGE
jgi:hypothetical protein